MIYAGIGSRDTAASMLEKIELLGAKLALKGWTLRSGGAAGADSAFETGCDAVKGAKEIFVPWFGYNNKHVAAPELTPEAYEIARECHGGGQSSWTYFNSGVRRLLARNVLILLGADLNSPVDVVIYHQCGWARTGGTGHALSVARKFGLETRELKDEYQIRQEARRAGLG